MIRLSAKTERVLNLLFLSCFIFYAASPLCFVSGRSAIRPFNGPAAILGRSINIFFLECIFSKLSEKDEDARDKDQIKFLIRKVRAILPEKCDVRTSLHDRLSLPSAIVSFFFEIWDELPRKSGKHRGYLEFNTLHSGHSPPAL